MNIGIVVHSQTGHTLSLAEILKERLLAAGHAVTLELVETSGRAKPGAADVQLKTRPEVDPYDALVFGSPVWGGVMSSAMTSYLEQVTSLQGKRVACMVTHIFPPGLGANQTISQMKEICESKGAIICGSGSVSWFPLGRKRRIAEVVDNLIGFIHEPNKPGHPLV
jgi:multimeric flavodoxin WrbA